MRTLTLSVELIREVPGSHTEMDVTIFMLHVACCMFQSDGYLCTVIRTLYLVIFLSSKAAAPRLASSRASKLATILSIPVSVLRRSKESTIEGSTPTISFKKARGSMTSRFLRMTPLTISCARTRSSPSCACRNVWYLREQPGKLEFQSRKSEEWNTGTI